MRLAIFVIGALTLVRTSVRNCLVKLAPTPKLPPIRTPWSCENFSPAESVRFVRSAELALPLSRYCVQNVPGHRSRRLGFGQFLGRPPSRLRAHRKHPSAASFCCASGLRPSSRSASSMRHRPRANVRGGETASLGNHRDQETTPDRVRATYRAERVTGPRRAAARRVAPNDLQPDPRRTAADDPDAGRLAAGAARLRAGRPRTPSKRATTGASPIAGRHRSSLPCRVDLGLRSSYEL